MVAPDFPHVAAAFEALTASLWRERELLERLLFDLTSQGLLLESGTLRWLAMSSAQILDGVDALREHEVTRAMSTEELTASLGLASSSTLACVTVEAPEPYRSMLHELGATLRELTDDLATTVRRNEQLLLALVGPDSERPASGEL